jgi:predicted transcriptional regulator of viral defense system
MAGPGPPRAGRLRRLTPVVHNPGGGRFQDGGLAPDDERVPADLPVVLDAADAPGVPCHPHEIARLVERSWLRPLLPGVYLAADVPRTPAVRAAAVREVLPAEVLAAGILCAGTAVWLHCGGEPPWPLDVVVPRRGGGPRLRGVAGLRVHEHRLYAQDTELVAGLTVTTAVRTAVDLARVLPAAEAVLRFAQLAAATGLQPREVTGYLRRLGPVPGLRAARAAVAAWRAADLTPGACR